MLLTHVFSWLVLPVFLTRKVLRSGSPELGLDKTSFALDTTAMAVTCAERQLLGRVRLPFGTSILCVATRRPSEEVSDV